MKIVNLFIIFLITCSCTFLYSAVAIPREVTLYGFEDDPQGWEIPDWAFAKKDNASEHISLSEYESSEGKYALELGVDFAAVPGWRGAYVERLVDITDWSLFKYLSVDIFLPKDAPRGLRARVILTVGESWKWTEMNKAIPLAPGEWNVIKVDLTPNSMNWRSFLSDSFRSDVRKVGVRIESNGGIAYKGPVYIDNVKLSD